jgi:hypothetical protein
MESTTGHSLYSNQPWQMNFDAADQTMELYFTGDMNDVDIGKCLKSVPAIVNGLPIKTFVINDDKVKRNPLALDWKIIERSWESFCRNGGEKIIVIHQAGLPEYMQKIYTEAFEKYGIPIGLEFKTFLH